MENENIRKAIIELSDRLGETVLEETEWRVLTDMASYNIDNTQESLYVMRVDKNKEEFPLLSVRGDEIYAWDEKGWHVILESEDPDSLIPVIINSWKEYIENQNEPLITNIRIIFKDIPKNTRKQEFPISTSLNSMAKGMLDDELFPNPQPSQCTDMTTLEKEYFYKKYYENWSASEKICAERKWGEVLEGLQNGDYYVLKNELFDTLTIIKKGFKKIYILTKNLPFTLLSDNENVDKISLFVDPKNLKKECGKYFEEKMIGKNKEIKFKSAYNDKYFRMSKGMLFSAGSMAYTIWKYEGILTDEQTNLFKIVEQK